MRPRPWGLVVLLSATATASYMCRVNVSVSGAMLMQELGLSQIQMGRVFSAFLLGYALFQVPAGMLADRLGTQRMLIMASWAWVLLTSLQTLAGKGFWWLASVDSLSWLLILRFLLGISEAPTFPAAAQGISRWIPPGMQGRANGLVIAAIGLGSALAPPIVSTTMIRWGWRCALIFSMLPALLVAFVWLRIRGRESEPIRKPDRVNPERGETGNRHRLGSSSFILLTASYTLQGYVGYIFVFWFYLYLVQERHFDLLRGAFISSLPWILSIISIPLGGLVSDRLASGRLGLKWGRRLVPMFGLAWAGVMLAFGAHTGNAYLAAIYLAVATALVLCVEGPFWATMMEIAVLKSGTGGGIMNMGSNIGGFISPWLTPVLAGRFGWENSLLIAAGLSIVGAALWLWINPPGEPPAGAGGPVGT